MLDYMFLLTERQSYVNPPTQKKKIKYISSEDIGQEQQKEKKKKNTKFTRVISMYGCSR
jgi:hypothetical protein